VNPTTDAKSHFSTFQDIEVEDNNFLSASRELPVFIPTTQAASQVQTPRAVGISAPPSVGFPSLDRRQLQRSLLSLLQKLLCSTGKGTSGGGRFPVTEILSSRTVLLSEADQNHTKKAGKEHAMRSRLLKWQ